MKVVIRCPLCGKKYYVIIPQDKPAETIHPIIRECITSHLCPQCQEETIGLGEDDEDDDWYWDSYGELDEPLEIH